MEHSQARNSRLKSQRIPGLSMSTCALRLSEIWPVILSLRPYSLKPAHCLKFTAQLCQPAHYKQIKDLTSLRRSPTCAPFFPATEVPGVAYREPRPVFFESDQAVVCARYHFSVLRCLQWRACGQVRCSAPASSVRRHSRVPPSGSRTQGSTWPGIRPAPARDLNANGA